MLQINATQNSPEIGHQCTEENQWMTTSKCMLHLIRLNEHQLLNYIQACKIKQA